MAEKASETGRAKDAGQSRLRPYEVGSLTQVVRFKSIAYSAGDLEVRADLLSH